MGRPASVYTRSAVLRTSFALALLALGLLVACDGGDGGPSPTREPIDGSTVVAIPTVERPDSVPEAAEAIAETRALGSIERQANEDPVAEDTRALNAASCEDDVALFETSEETLYAAFPPSDAPPCDRFWDDATADLFVGEEVAIVLEVTPERRRVLIETIDGAQGEFSVGGIWIE